MKSVIDILDLTTEEIDDLINIAKDIMAHPEYFKEQCRGKKIATLFFEPSTRTRLSFEAAMYELGGDVLSVSGANSSAAKGESVYDTAKIMSFYADIIAMRHYKEGAALRLARNASVPVINAGDGGHCHPTQTLADLCTISLKKGGFDNLTVGLCGDLKYGRTVHSLINALSRYKNIKFLLISPSELALPDYEKAVIEKSGMLYEQTDNLENALPELDVLYMTRIQRERFDDISEYERLKDSYVLNAEKMKSAKKDCIVLHPLPRVNEISTDFDNDPRALYFEQANNGKYMRMALILKLLFGNMQEKEIEYIKDKVCDNPRCITSCEQEVEQLFLMNDDGKTCRCAYCEKEQKI
ncbi:MAG: aspartate carbamoyltransferase [Clostridiales bacterium]|nr:aspartate carbamoyltransferase [Candidatus Equinaster intestinalis]